MANEFVFSSSLYFPSNIYDVSSVLEAAAGGNRQSVGSVHKENYLYKGATNKNRNMLTIDEGKAQSGKG